MGLCDPKPQIREGAVEALRACLIDMSKRADKYRLECYYSLYEEAKKNILRAKHSYHIHGSLLVIGELLQHTGEFMVPRFEEVAANILR
jgi:FKBP12-rapamycin complex-associated protein